MKKSTNQHFQRRQKEFYAGVKKAKAEKAKAEKETGVTAGEAAAAANRRAQLAEAELARIKKVSIRSLHILMTISQSLCCFVYAFVSSLSHSLLIPCFTFSPSLALHLTFSLSFPRFLCACISFVSFLAQISANIPRFL